MPWGDDIERDISRFLKPFKCKNKYTSIKHVIFGKIA